MTPADKGIAAARREGTSWTKNADEIDRLKAANAELLAALERFANAMQQRSNAVTQNYRVLLAMLSPLSPKRKGNSYDHHTSHRVPCG